MVIKTICELDNMIKANKIDLTRYNISYKDAVEYLANAQYLFINNLHIKLI